MKSLKIFSLLFLFVMIYSSCEKDKSLTAKSNSTAMRIDIFSFLDCYYSAPHDSLTTQQKLFGKWQMIQLQGGGFGGHDTVIFPTTRVVLEFDSAFSFTEFENDVAVDNGTWSLLGDGYGNYELMNTVYGYSLVSFCDDKLLLSTAYMDGDDIFFVRIN